MKRTLRGFTMVELMMSLAVLALGVSGVIAMQKVSIASNQHAKNLTLARAIAEGWADALTTDAALWNTVQDLNQTTWLNTIAAGAGNELTWFRPPWSTSRQLGAAFDPLGAPLQSTSDPAVAFCTDIRLAYIDPGTLLGAGAVRAEIRVAWRRENAQTQNPVGPDFCNPAVLNPENLRLPGFANGFHFVYLTTVVAQQPGIQ